MTPKEAYEYMENEIRCVQRSKICDRDCARCELVKEDKPLIEAYGVAISALKKQIPTKPQILTYKLLIEAGWKHKCPNCGCAVGKNKYTDYEYLNEYEDYCTQCGQALDWSGIV